MSAEEITYLDLSAKEEQQNWQAVNVTAEAFSGGIKLHSEGEGFFIRQTEENTPVDTVRLVYSSPADAKISLIWKKAGESNEYFQYGVNLPAAPAGAAYTIGTALISDWDRTPTAFGFKLEPKTLIILQQVETGYFTLSEGIAMRWKNFWTFDDYTPRTINFLWGPQIFKEKPDLLALFKALPPPIKSVNTVFYYLLAAAIIFSAGWKLINRNRPEKTRYCLAGLSLAVICLWVFYDVRMGAEFLSYFKDDFDSYISRPEAERSFRDRGNFYTFVNEVKKHTALEPMYMFLTSYRWPYLGSIRYYTYPSLPKQIKDGERPRLWIVYAQKGISLNADNQLVLDGEVLTEKGSVLFSLSSEAFIFRENP